MNSCRPWELGPRERRYHLTVRFLLAGKGVSLSIPPLAFVLFLALGFASYQLANTQTLSLQQRQAKRLAELERKNEQLQNFLDHKEKERGQMVALAEARSEELWNELEERDDELSRLWKVVGKRPSEVELDDNRRRRSLSGSRAGRSGRDSLRVKTDFSQLDEQFQEKQKELESLSLAAKAYRRRKIREYQRELASRTPSIWPCKGEMTSKFGNRVHPVYGIGRFHAGCDFTADYGTEIYATAAGTIETSGWLGGYGKTIEIDHGRNLKTLYGHCSELLVKKGDKVIKGQLIAKVGTTGLSSGPHCHYEVHKGKKQIDPEPYLKEKDAPQPIAKL